MKTVKIQERTNQYRRDLAPNVLLFLIFLAYQKYIGSATESEGQSSVPKPTLVYFSSLLESVVKVLNVCLMWKRCRQLAPPKKKKLQNSKRRISLLLPRW